MSVAVVGAGAIGVLLAAELTVAGNDVVVCARRPFDRLVVDSDGGAPRDLPARVITEPSGSADWVVVAMKAHDSPAAAPWAQALGGQVVAVQNGIEHRANLGEDALPAIIMAATERLGEGHVHHRFGHLLVVPEGGVGEGFAALLEHSIFDVQLTADFTTAAWRKLLRNATGNTITALTGGRMGIFREPRIRELGREVLAEVLAVARAEGAQLGDDEVEQVLEAFAAMPADSGTSMLYDRLSGRPLEYDALTGAVVRAAERHGIDVPLNRALLALLATLST
jgi:2-dehydropantoate 2-reductase